MTTPQPHVSLFHGIIKLARHLDNKTAASLTVKAATLLGGVGVQNDTPWVVVVLH